MTDKEKLIEINNSIRAAEWKRDTDTLEKILSEDLIFRRANGNFADRKTYLDGLKDPNNIYEHLENVDTEVKINEANNLAIVTVTVKASGKRGEKGDPFRGLYKNIRFFRKTEEWKMYAWYNETIGTGSILHIPANHFIYKPRPENMTGHVEINDSSDLPESPHLRAFSVKFGNGALTNRHNHIGAQVLFVESGPVFVEQENDPPFDINKGDQVYNQKIDGIDMALNKEKQ